MMKRFKFEEKLPKNRVNKMNFLCKEDKRKTKGYLFDSLVYRYIRAREHMAECEYLRDRSSLKSTESHDWLTYKKMANRDILRFIELLNEAIGEHD